MGDGKLVEELDGMLWRIEGNYHREGAGPGSRFEGQTLQTVQARALLRRIVEWLAERGRLTPDGAETTQKWGVRLTRNIDGETEDRPLASREDAEEFIAAANAANAAAPAERAAWEWTPGLIRQQVITTPWEPVAEETNGQH